MGPKPSRGPGEEITSPVEPTWSGFKITCPAGHQFVMSTVELTTGVLPGDGLRPRCPDCGVIYALSLETSTTVRRWAEYRSRLERARMWTW